MTDHPKRPRDANQLAKLVTDLATGDATERPKAEAQRHGGIKGAAARNRVLTAEERKRIAAKAAKARWQKGPAARETKEQS